MKRIFIPIIVAAAATFACARPHPVVVTAPTHHAPRSAEELTVGVARVDVTPPPGVSTFGYAPDAMVTNGYWSRLYCRVFVVKPATAEPLAIIPCDLAAIGAALHHRVADKVKDILPRSRIMLTATHTHAGPAHYFESEAYGGVTSSRLPGFDEAMLEMLASRIAEGIERANNRLRPARLRWAHTNAWKLTRNRSLQAYLTNSPNFSESHQPGAVGPLTDEERAIDPALDVLQIIETTPVTQQPVGPLGWLVFFAMHPTVLPYSSRLLNADVFGVTSRVLEGKLRPLRAHDDSRCKQVKNGRLQCPNLADFDPLVGVINTNEGDISPVWTFGNTEEAIKIGTQLAERAFRTYEPAATFNDKVLIDSRYLEADLPAACLLHGSSLCARGELGNATGHGGSDHPASTDAIFPSDNDLDIGRDDCQAPKPEMLGKIQDFLLTTHADRFPEHVSFGLVRVDDTWLAFVPAELTVHAGWSVRKRIEELAKDKVSGPQHYVIGGLANAYIQYVATRPEYNLQYYEGASTLYGPRSAEYIAERFEILTRSMLGQDADKWIAQGQPPVDAIVNYPFDFAPQRERLARPTGPQLSQVVGRGATDLCRLKLAADRDSVCFRWRDGGPGRVTMSNPDGEPWVELVGADSQEPVPSCAVRGNGFDCDPLAAIDDLGLDFQTRIHGRDGNGYQWSTLFRPSLGESIYLKQAGKVRLRIRGDAKSEAVTSPAFAPADLPMCSDKMVRDCTDAAR